MSSVQTGALCKSLDNFLFSQDLVSLRSSLNSQDENPCFLYLRCDPKGGEEIVSVGILSSARNMEVYLGEEYCGTSRGKNVCSEPDDRFVTRSCAGVPPKQCDFSSAFVVFVDSLTLMPDTRREEIKTYQQERKFLLLRVLGDSLGQLSQFL